MSAVRSFNVLLRGNCLSNNLLLLSLSPFRMDVAANSTLSSAEVSKFRVMSADWWNPNGVCKPLHSMNRLRVDLVKEGLVSTGVISKESVENEGLPLSGISALDVGCGAGILTEALARLGANVTGIDACEENIQVAREHVSEDEEIRDRVKYECSTIEAFPKEMFDFVAASEVLEHVENQRLFVSTCCSFLKDTGSIFFTTINRQVFSLEMSINGQAHQ